MQGNHQSPAGNGIAMFNIGALLFIAGIITVCWAFIMPTTVPTELTYSATSGYSHSVHNSGLMQSQLMVLLSGLALFIVGAMIAAIASAVTAIRSF
jgi:hypothetical protein